MLPIVHAQTEVFGHDRITFFERDGATVIIIADGAGGRSGAVKAAELVDRKTREALVRFAPDVHDPITWTQILAHIDTAILDDPEAGQCAACILSIRGDQIIGSSVGSCRAMLVGNVGYRELTGRQNERPRLGDGGALPVHFGPVQASGRLLVMTDGLPNAHALSDITAALRAAPFEDAARALTDLAGPAPDDDISVLCATWLHLA